MMKEAFHFTITYFWIQMIDYGITKSAGNNYEKFADFYRANPELNNEKLYLNYYNQQTIFSKEAEKQMVLPDRKKLPSILGAK